MQIAGEAQAFLVGGAHALLLVENTELIAHAVDVRRERPQLIAVLDAELPSEIAFGDARHTHADRSQRADDRERDRKAEQERKDKTRSCEAKHDELRAEIRVTGVANALSDLSVGTIDELVG